MPPRATLSLPALRYWRARRAMRQQELGTAAGVHWMTVLRIERGGLAEMVTIRQLATALQVEPADLMAQPPES
jgi:DNA-binding XRE family transcriptional regulator